MIFKAKNVMEMITNDVRVDIIFEYSDNVIGPR